MERRKRETNETRVIQMTLLELMPILMQGGFKLLLAIMGVVGARLMLASLDKHSDTFKGIVDGFSPEGKAMYYSARFIGVCILFGLVLS